MAPSGISGLETALGLSLRLVHEGVLTIQRLVEKMSLHPARILRMKDRGMLQVGSVADIVIVDTNREWKVDADNFISKGKNTPFQGWMIKGMAVTTICKGKIYEK
jgi:dihydroorotase